jgi:hypothetical protein
MFESLEAFWILGKVFICESWSAVEILFLFNTASELGWIPF